LTVFLARRFERNAINKWQWHAPIYLSHPPPVEFLTCLVCTQQFLGEREIAKKKSAK